MDCQQAAQELVVVALVVVGMGLQAVEWVVVE
jgi:hypothetical protein